jgi:hypothetical protein
LTDPSKPIDDEAQQAIVRQMRAALDATGSVPADDPRRHLRVRLRAAQLLVHALRGAEGEAGMRMAWDAAVEEFGTSIELFGSTIGLIAEFAADRDTLTARLQTEIANMALLIEDVRMDDK